MGPCMCVAVGITVVSIEGMSTSDGCVALVVVEVPRLVVELGFDDELGELARVAGAVQDEEVDGPHNELGELDLVLVVVDADEHCLALCGEEDVELHAQWAALFL